MIKKNILYTRYINKLIGLKKSVNMSEEMQKVSLFMITFILIIVALLPLLSTIQNGFESTDGYYEQYN